MSDWIELADWMKDLSDNTPIQSLTIPGTHDSGAYDITLAKRIWSKTQDADIKDQLKMGIRFLDIRLNLDAGHLKVYHGPADCNLNFHQGSNSVIGYCKDFLADNPSEIIIMSVKEEGDWRDFDIKVREAIDADPIWYKLEQWPKLGDARGKIVLMRRWNTYKAPYGIDAMLDWEGKIFQTPFLWVQDDWDYIGIPSPDDCKNKFGYVERLYQLASLEPNNDRLVLNYLSANGGFAKPPFRFAKGDWGDPGELARMQQLLEGDIYGARCGVIAMDFAGSDTAIDLIPLLVGRNSMDDTSYWSSWANDYLWGFSNPKMFTLGPVNALSAVEQNGYGIINMRLGFLDPDTQAQRWTDWNSRNNTQGKLTNVYLGDGKTATQLKVWVQNKQYGIIDAALVAADQSESDRLTKNKEDGTAILVNFGNTSTEIYGFKTQENQGNGLINIMIGKR